MTVVIVKIIMWRIKFVEWKLYLVKQCTRVVVRRVYTVFLRQAVIIIGNKKLDASLKTGDYKKTDSDINSLCFVCCTNITANSFKYTFGDIRCSYGNILTAIVTAFVINVALYFNYLCVEGYRVYRFCCCLRRRGVMKEF